VQIATSLGAGNFAQDPLLVDPDGPDGVVGTADDDPSLSPGSPAIDAGSNDAVAGQALDLGLLPRIVDDPQSTDVGSGTNALADVGAFEFHSLIGSGTELSLAAGGLVRLELQAGPALAGEVFIVLGTGSGTVPGLKFGGLELTLNPDPYFFHTLNEPSTLPLFHSIGTLDQEGVAETIFFMPPGIDPILAGLLLHHAGAVLDPSTYLPELTTTAFPLQLLF